MSLINGYMYRLVMRQGLSARVPTMQQGELGWDIDTSTLRVGNDTSIPFKVPTTGSKGVFDFSTADKFIMPGGIAFEMGGKIDGVTISKLNQSNGLMVRRGDDNFGSTKIISGDNTVLIDNGDGAQTKDMDIRVNIDLVAAAARPQFTAADEPPVNPKVNDWWFQTNIGVMYQRISDGINEVWFDVS